MSVSSQWGNLGAKLPLFLVFSHFLSFPLDTVVLLTWRSLVYMFCSRREILAVLSGHPLLQRPHLTPCVQESAPSSWMLHTCLDSVWHHASGIAVELFRCTEDDPRSWNYVPGYRPGTVDTWHLLGHTNTPPCFFKIRQRPSLGQMGF